MHDDEPDHDTGMWSVQLECDRRGQPTVKVIDIDAIARGAHLLPIYGSSCVIVSTISHLSSFCLYLISMLCHMHKHLLLFTHTRIQPRVRI